MHTDLLLHNIRINRHLCLKISFRESVSSVQSVVYKHVFLGAKIKNTIFAKIYRMKKICIFCGSSMGFDPIYKEKAAELGQVLAENGCELLYGGGSVGLMKIVADVMMKRHRKVIGTITQHLLDMRVGHPEIDELIVVETMAERKKILVDMAVGFIALPGGIGTMDEFF